MLRCFNGAALGRTRKLDQYSTRRFLIRKLQWGRARKNAETPSRNGKTQTGRPLLQWGRARKNAETRLFDLGGDAEQVASMGPRSEERGNSTGLFARLMIDLASMGPRSEERGNFPNNPSGIDFMAASMGPRSEERGNFDSCQFLMRDFSRFNGAALGRTRKRLLEWFGYRSQSLASMGPRSEERGNCRNVRIRRSR